MPDLNVIGVGKNEAYEKRIAALEAEVERQSQHAMSMMEKCEVMFDDLQASKERIAALESALRAIAEHPHCDSEEKNDFLAGYALGHRCAADIARKALGDKPKETT